MKRINYLQLFVLLLIIGCSGNSGTTDPPDGPNPNLNKLAVGESANDMLSAANYDRMTIEIVSVDGYELDQAVIDDFESFLQELVHKPNGIIVKTSSVSAPGLAPYSVNDILSFEDQIRTEYNDGEELAVFIFISEDAYTEENVLGLAYRNTSFAIMGGRIAELTGGVGEPDEDVVLQTVLRHEMGHLLGLVNVGTPMQTDHQDVAHGKHCDVEDCLMYYAVETGDFLSNLIGAGSPPELESQCRDDLTANGGI